jgi:hypothetical protein
MKHSVKSCFKCLDVGSDEVSSSLQLGHSQQGINEGLMFGVLRASAFWKPNQATQPKSFASIGSDFVLELNGGL